MIVRSYRDVREEPVKIEGVENTTIRWLIDDKTGPNFAMRRYELKGTIPRHTHSHEHEVYFLEGRGEVITEEGKTREVGPGDFAYIPPNEVHGFKSLDTEKPLAFLCVVPRNRGKTTFTTTC